MAAGHTIVDGDSVGGNDFRWQLFWKDKKSAESFWDKGLLMNFQLGQCFEISDGL